MNCQEVERLGRELGGATLMDAGVRQAALAHARECVRCDARLQDERTLSAGLKALAASDEARAVGDRVETELLAAFRRQQPAPALQPALRPATVLPWRRWAVAAAVLLALGLLAYTGRQRASQDSLVVQPTPAPVTLPQTTLPPSFLTAQREEAPVQKQQPRSAPATLLRRAESRLAQVGTRAEKATAPPVLIADGMTIYGDETEAVTDFVALDPGADVGPMESGQLLRVEVPRQTLARYGLPINAALADATVKADLLVSEDGRAHAIRFVR